MVLVYAEGRFVKATAGAAVTAGQLVELTDNETVAPASADSTKVVGVAMKDAAANELVTVVTEGVVELTASGAIAAGDRVAADAGGKVKAWSAAAAGDSAKIVGVALTSASADGDKVKVLMR